MSRMWFGGTRHPELGYRTGLPGSARSVGWIRFDREERLWRAVCAEWRHHELGQSYTKGGAAELVREHYLSEHR